jgi:PhoH-like ATPase
MRTTYVLDTNVLLSDGNALTAFSNSDVVIPSVVLEELDSKKKLMDELGRNARYISRQLDGFRELGKLHEGVQLENGSILKVVIHNPNSIVFDAFLDDKNDNAIIAVAHFLTETNPDTILVSKDVLVRIKADIVNVQAEDYQYDKVASSEDDLYQGYTEILVDDGLIDEFYKGKGLKATKDFSSFDENHFFILKSNLLNNKSAICKRSGKKLVPLYNYSDNMGVFGLTHKNVEQMMALELLLDDSIPLVTLSGKAGTGKTLLALATALHKTEDERKYTKVLVARPVVPMGKDIGFLPGEKEEKLRPWMQPIYDNLEFLFDCKSEKELSQTLTGYEDIIKVEALTYIRGRSIANQFIIIDEAQNLSQHEVKTIATRMGEGSKLVLVGDPYQIDNPYLIEKMKSVKETGHITLQRGERSTLAQLCADML